MSKYVAYANQTQADSIIAHSRNMGFDGEILPTCKQVKIDVKAETDGIFNHLLEVLASTL